MLRSPPLLLVAALAFVGGCTPSAPAPTPGGVGEPAPSGGPKPAAISSGALRTRPNTCPPWDRAISDVRASTQAGGRADFRREFRYDRDKAILGVHDSDPFAQGAETKDPRVIDRQRPLAPEESARIDAALFAICASEAALKARCAPGGCAQLVVTAPGAKVTVEDHEIVGRVMGVFSPFFPELRKR